MALDVFPDIDFGLRVRYRETWKTLISKSEGEVEQRLGKGTRAIRQWSIECDTSPGAETDSVRNFFTKMKGQNTAFMFKTRDARDWKKTYLGTGTGSRTVFVLNVSAYTGTPVIYVNGSAVSASIASGGPNGTYNVTISAPAAGAVVEADVVGPLVPLVRFLDDSYEDEYVASGFYTFRAQMIEDKVDIT